ncbi:ArsR/SmtB family transcription factor [Paraferrimonas sedimenticola]|uniref:Transcriptional regulator n=1 Tax=Paraferrimonas sedimenticola TaxID=375674 RepID=A0AA37RQ70_9GAMM|nr:metalloregulator ArsR/SmtB family transcription factor [Paraferrimonas sedimenticola]GLP95045.1 transcriptional regulator [Paraferrimonas sedimenticola]
MEMLVNPLAFFKSLADETRLKALLLIEREGELCVCELTQALDISQPKISRHLAQLRQAEVVTTLRQGQWIYYRINPELPSWCLSTLGATLAENPDYISANIALLEAMGDRPQRVAQCCN